MEENIALDSYLHHMLSLCDEWEQHILVYMNPSYQMSSEYVVLLYCSHPPDFTLTNCFAITFSGSLFFLFQFLKLP